MEAKSEAKAMALVPLDLAGQALAVKSLTDQVDLIHKAMQAVMKPRVHYGIIQGCKKPSLWQPGADVLNLMFRLRPEYTILSTTRQDGLIAYAVQCNLVHMPTTQLVAVGIGSCNTREAKYLNAINTRGCSHFDLENTILKMACKRAKVAATLNGTGAADMFSQDGRPDVEDEEDSPFNGAPPPSQAPERRRPGRPRGSTNAPTQEPQPEEPSPHREPGEEPPDGDILKPPAEEAEALWAHWEDLRGAIVDPKAMLRICSAAGVQRIHSQLPLVTLQAVIAAAEKEVS